MSNNLNGTISLFDAFAESNAIPEEMKKKEEEKKKKESTKKGSKKTSKPKVEKYDLPLVVRYAQQNIELTAEHFGGVEKVTLEEVRKYLEDDYPELGKERTLMEYDKDKGLVIPIVRGSRKGCR